MKLRVVLFLTWFAISFAPFESARAQDDGPKVSIIPRPSKRAAKKNTNSGAIRMDVRVVLVPVMVTDTYQRPVKDLKKENFRLYEDGVEQTISQVFSQE